MEQDLCLLPLLGGRDADESDWTWASGSPGCGEWSLLISVGEADDRPQVPLSYRDPDLWATYLQTLWYTKDRDQVGSVVEGLASWDGIGIYFDSSTNDVQVGSHILSSSCLPVLTLILTILILPVAIVTSPAEQPCHPSAGQ